MESEFERGKRLLIEGLSGYVKLFEPYLQIFEGMKILDIPDFFERGKGKTEERENADVWKLLLSSFLSDMRGAKNREDILQAIEDNREFMKRLM